MSDPVRNVVTIRRPVGQMPTARPSNEPPLISFTFPRKVALFVPIKPPEYIHRIARIVLEQPAEKGERFLRREMEVVSENLIATGADPTAIRREVGKLEAAIRIQLWHLVMSSGAPQ